MRRTPLLRSVPFPVLSLVALGACSVGTERTEQAPAPVEVTGAGTPPTDDGEQSETATAVVNTDDFRYVLVTYNDMTREVTEGYLAYTPTQRSIFAGASLAGWSISADGGAHFQYGGKVRPPAGWSVMWGDPAITVNRTDQHYVYISNIAVPDSKFPVSGRIDGPINNFLGGACIIRSTDYGKTFSSASADCLTNGGAFYDGGSMVTTSSGAVYAAWNNVTAGTIEVWRAPSPTGTFVRIANPFPSAGTIESHPRLRYDVVTNRVYVMGQSSVGSTPNEMLNSFPTVSPFDFIAGQLLLDYYDDGHGAAGSWKGGISVASDSLVNPVIPLDTGDPFGFVRTGPQFAFDIGDASVNGDDAIRVGYTARRPNGSRAIKVVRCTREIECLPTTEWSTTGLTGHQWNPDVRTQLSFLTVPSVWKLSYTSTSGETGMHVGWKQGALAVIGTGTRTFLEFGLGDAHATVCPDLRGYWGDYDNMEILFASLDTGQTSFFRARSSSEPGCSYRWQFTASPLHVSGVSF